MTGRKNRQSSQNIAYQQEQPLNRNILNYQAKKKSSEAQENMLDYPKKWKILSILSKIQGKKSYSDKTPSQTQESEP